MYDFRKHYDFSVSNTTDESIINKMFHGATLNNLLNENLKIKDYSDTVTGVFMIYQSLSPEFAKALPVSERTVFRRKTKVIEIYTVMDYQTVLNASETEMLQLFKETYLRGVKQFMKRKDFDSERFYEDVKRVFALV